ncbi:hypothetical protein WICMUC_004709 [Wickerhamomyces mucosus]|uniref:glucan 1,4-alpha-glucosidase n=1 Tax=Wickerhamomyces mucosus TaxID=1378264 RepID=A0A9P8PFP4_9ASCO|nr:hypothetical protein WICMUC_004709 [Wickerhamomyces mucosus]
MFKTIILLLFLIYSNSLILPYLWKYLPQLNDYNSNGSNINNLIPIISPNDLPNFQKINSRLFNPFKDYSSISNYNLLNPYYITIENFNLQSNFKPFQIFPYKLISRDLFENWITNQFEISFDNMLKNLGDLTLNPDLIQNQSVAIGAVVASRSKIQPDYFYQWIRDGAITINSIINHLNEFDLYQNKTLRLTVENYLDNSYNLQRTDNPTGKFDPLDLSSLGEPKFLVDSTPFKRVWGRPQNDGPGLRIITISNFLKHLKIWNLELLGTDKNIFQSTRDVYFKIIKLDLKFIIKHWADKHFDLWEEIDSHHFFTALTQLKALKIGIKLFEQFNDDELEFFNQLNQEYNRLLEYIEKDSGFIDYNLNHIIETPSILDKRSGLDAAILIGSLLTHDDLEEDFPFDVNEGLILNTLSEMIKTMKYIYPINHNRINLNLGIALGRYPEDLYDGIRINEGNPWFLTTISASELLYKLISKLYNDEKDLIIDSKNQHFYFNNIIEVNKIVQFNDPKFLFQSYNNVILTIPYNSLAFNQTAKNLLDFADSFLDVIREHVGDDGSMSEQFNKYTGFMQGAEDLTWSYGSFWNAFRWRQRALKFIN